MKTKLLFGSTLLVLCGMAVAPTCQTAFAAEANADQTAGGHSLDFARGSRGTQMLMRDPSGTVQHAGPAVQALLGDDASHDYALASGTTSFILNLSKIELLNSFTISNSGAEGKMTVSVSSAHRSFDDAGWQRVGNEENLDGRSTVSCDFGSVEGRYVKVDFVTRTPGRITSFGLLGGTTAQRANPTAAVNYVTTPTRAEVAASVDSRGSFYDYASLSVGARVVAVSHADSLNEAQFMIDNNPATAFAFDAADANPTAVIDLGTARKVGRVNCDFEAPAGQLDFYLVDNAYGNEGTQVALNYVTPPGVTPVANPATLNYNAPQSLGDRKAVGSVATTGEPGVNHVSVNLNGLTGRFLIAAFHRSGHRHSGDFKDAGDPKDFKDKNVAIADNPVKVEGISAFGDPPSAQSIPLLPPPGAVVSP